jgi:hypothetical protein
MLVDIVFPGWVPFVYLAIAEDVADFIKAHDIVLNNYDFDTFVGGHLTRLGTRDDVVTQQEFVSDLEKAPAKLTTKFNLVISPNKLVGLTIHGYFILSTLMQ